MTSVKENSSTTDLEIRSTRKGPTPPRVWNHKLHKKLFTLGLIQSHSKPCVYILARGSTSKEEAADKAMMVVSIYVDTILLAGPHPELVHKVEMKLAEEFKMTDGTEFSFILC